MTTTTDPKLAAVDRDKIHALLDGALADLGATVTTAMISIGDRVGLFKGLADGGPATPAELAERTGTVRALRARVAAGCRGGWLCRVRPRERSLLTQPRAGGRAGKRIGPVPPGWRLRVVLAAVRAEPLIADRFRTGDGLAWADHDPRLFDGTERFFGGLYTSFLVGTWIAALDGVQAKLERGARVADVGCGHGASTILMAQASRLDLCRVRQSRSIDRSRDKAAARPGSRSGAASSVGRRCLRRSRVRPHRAPRLPARYGRPLAAARQTRAALAEDRTWMIVEPGPAAASREPRPDGSPLVWHVDAHLFAHALSRDGEAALAGRQARLAFDRSPSRRDPPFPACERFALQLRVRGAALSPATCEPAPFSDPPQQKCSVASRHSR